MNLEVGDIYLTRDNLLGMVLRRREANSRYPLVVRILGISGAHYYTSRGTVFETRDDHRDFVEKIAAGGVRGLLKRMRDLEQALYEERNRRRDLERAKP